MIWTIAARKWVPTHTTIDVAPSLTYLDQEKAMPFCRKCGKENFDESVFCRFCGTALTQSSDASVQKQSSVPHSNKSLAISPAIVAAVQAVLVFGTCAIIPYLFGSILGWPARAINGLLPDHTCAGVQTRSWDMYSCSLEAGLLAMAGPVILMVLILLLRKPLNKRIGLLIPKLPEMTRFLVLPILATTIFTIVWAGFHEDTWNQTGIIPQKLFPAVIGLFTYIVARFGPGIHHAWRSFFESRDKCPKWIRFIAVLAIPMLISVAATYQESVSQEALKEQFIVLIALIVAYMLISPHARETSTGESSSGKVGHLQTGGQAIRNFALILGGSALTGILFDQYLMDVALADCSSSELDCTQTAEMAGYSATTATGGGVIGAASVGLSTQIASTASTAGGLAGATTLPDVGGGSAGVTVPLSSGPSGGMRPGGQLSEHPEGELAKSLSSDSELVQKLADLFPSDDDLKVTAEAIRNRHIEEIVATHNFGCPETKLGSPSIWSPFGSVADVMKGSLDRAEFKAPKPSEKPVHQPKPAPPPVEQEITVGLKDLPHGKVKGGRYYSAHKPDPTNPFNEFIESTIRANPYKTNAQKVAEVVRASKAYHYGDVAFKATKLLPAATRTTMEGLPALLSPTPDNKGSMLMLTRDKLFEENVPDLIETYGVTNPADIVKDQVLKPSTLNDLYDKLDDARGIRAYIMEQPETRMELEAAINESRTNNRKEELKALIEIRKYFNSLGGSNVTFK